MDEKRAHLQDDPICLREREKCVDVPEACLPGIRKNISLSFSFPSLCQCDIVTEICRHVELYYDNLH